MYLHVFDFLPLSLHLYLCTNQAISEEEISFLLELWCHWCAVNKISSSKFTLESPFFSNHGNINNIKAKYISIKKHYTAVYYINTPGSMVANQDHVTQH